MDEVLRGSDWTINYDDDDVEEDDEEYGHQYDDYEDLFSNETMSNADEKEDDKEVGLRKEVGQLIMLQRYLDSIQEKFSEKEFAVLKSREELMACRARLRALEEEVTQTEGSITAMQESENIPSLHRLNGKKAKLQHEIENEKKVEQEIQKNLEIAELELVQVELEQKHYAQLAEQTLGKQEVIKKHKEKMANYRLAKQDVTAKSMEKKYKIAKKNLQEKVAAQKRERDRVMNNAIVNHEKAKQFLKQSLSRIKQQEKSVKEIEQQQVDRKVGSIIELKDSISLNKDNLKALQARDAVRMKKKRDAEKAEYQRILNQGENPEFYMLIQKRIAEKEKIKSDLIAKQQQEKVKIVENILKEEENLKMRMKQQPWLFADKNEEKKKQVKHLPKPPVHEKLSLTDDYEPVFLNRSKHIDASLSETTERESVVDGSPNEPIRSSPDPPRAHALRQAEQDDVVLTQPEFEGLWEQKRKFNRTLKKAGEGDRSMKPVGGTKMEQEILGQVLEKHKKNIVKKQIAGGREFKGQPFYSKPDVIHFKDLDVGKVYKKKIVITNVSYSINFLRLTGLSEHLKDFIKIDFNPPGQMSAGMSCDMYVTFKPMINEDLEGEVSFLAQTGPFTIPLKCTTKKCDLSVDTDAISFGTQVIGETIRRSVTLVNNGALGTRFEFLKVPDKPPTTYSLETSLGRLTTTETSAMIANDVSEPLKTSTTMVRETANQPTRETTNQPTRETTKKSKRAMPSVPNTSDTSTRQAAGTMQKEDAIEGTEEGEFEPPMQLTERYSLPIEEEEIDFVTSATTATGFNEPLPEELKVGEVMSGEVEPFSSVRLDVVFAPCIPGDIRATFHIVFADQSSKPINIKVSALAIDVPVWLERQNVDLRICMFDRLYQEQIQVHNRASTALRLHFEVPKELQGHVELLPKTGFIQAKSKFVAQLKFLPRHSLAEDAGGLFDPGTGVLEAPMVVRVADQTRPVPFVVNAVVTSSDLEFDQTSIDFGCCTVKESVVHTVKLTNHSILPQTFGFVGVPDYIDIQPNDGFGKIFPLETIELDVIMSATQAKQYDFSLTCRSGINRDFPIACKAVGVLPPLELSHQVVHLAATPLDDVATSYLYVINSHTSANEFTHPVPRIGKGEIVPVGPTSFEFVIPEDAPIALHPMVGTVMPGQKCHITVEFSPQLDEAVVREESCKVAVELREKMVKDEEERLKREAEEAEAKQLEEEKKKGKKTPKTPASKSKSRSEAAEKASKSSAKVAADTPGLELPPIPTPDTVDKNSQAYKTAYSYLTRIYSGSFQSFRIPCFVASGSCSESSFSSPLSYNEANALYLEVHCPVIKPPVVVISNCGHRVLDFGPISIGQNAIKPVSIQNISDQPVELSASVLDTSGPFLMLNALRPLLPDETHTVLVSFTPTVGKICQEVLRFRGPNSSLNVNLVGQGVNPDLRLDLPDNKLHFGHVLQGETITSTFNIENKSLLTVKYAIHMDSASLLRHQHQQQLPEFVSRNNEARKTLVGTLNHNGLCVFDCVPCAGELKTNEKQEICVSFRPDHDSRHYSDGARFVLFNSELSHVIHMTGIAHAQTMYVEGDDPLDVSVESLALDAKNTDATEETASLQSSKKVIFLSFKSRVTPKGFEPSTRKLTIGCVKSNNVTKKAAEWTVEPSPILTSQGFVVDPLKSSVDPDTPKQLTFTWTPPEDHDPSLPINASVVLILKSDVTTTYNVLLNGLITFS